MFNADDSTAPLLPNGLSADGWTCMPDPEDAGLEGLLRHTDAAYVVLTDRTDWASERTIGRWDLPEDESRDEIALEGLNWARRLATEKGWQGVARVRAKVYAPKGSQLLGSCHWSVVRTEANPSVPVPTFDDAQALAFGRMSTTYERIVGLMFQTMLRSQQLHFAQMDHIESQHRSNLEQVHRLREAEIARMYDDAASARDAAQKEASTALGKQALDQLGALVNAMMASEIGGDLASSLGPAVRAALANPEVRKALQDEENVKHIASLLQSADSDLLGLLSGVGANERLRGALRHPAVREMLQDRDQAEALAGMLEELVADDFIPDPNAASGEEAP